MHVLLLNDFSVSPPNEARPQLVLARMPKRTPSQSAIAEQPQVVHVRPSNAVAYARVRVGKLEGQGVSPVFVTHITAPGGRHAPPGQVFEAGSGHASSAVSKGAGRATGVPPLAAKVLGVAAY